MSGQEKMEIKVVPPRQEEQLESPLPAFALNEEESRRFVYHDRQLVMDSEDHLFRDFEVPESSEEKVVKKEEEKDVEYVSYFSSSENTDSLKREFQSVRKLQQECRLVQQIIFATSNDPIYDYKIGFESEDEDKQSTELALQPESSLAKKERKIIRDLDHENNQVEE